MSETELQTEPMRPAGDASDARNGVPDAFPGEPGSLGPGEPGPVPDARGFAPRAGGPASLLVVLAPQAPGALVETLTQLAEAFPAQTVSVATATGTLPEDLAGSSFPTLQMLDVSALPAPGSQTANGSSWAANGSSWTLTAADFLRAFELNRSLRAPAVLLLGPGANGLSARAIAELAAAVTVSHADLAVPHYRLPPRAGLVNTAILYPLSRALFGTSVRFPLAVDLGLSATFAERLATDAQRFTAAGNDGALLWPVTQASVAGAGIAETDGGPRPQPAPPSPDLNTLLAEVCGSLFADIDARASWWQRSRVAAPTRPSPVEAAGESMGAPPEIAPFIDSFQLAYGNLHEIWSLVLPPQTLLGLKRLAATSAENFYLSESLWARIVYDFLLGYRLRTLNRNHLLGALTPLYLAWVASYLHNAASPAAAEALAEKQAAAFEADKPYLVSRWRWPDRFNP